MKYRATRFVGLFCKIQVTQTPGAFIYFERVADLKRSSMWMCSHGQKCRKMEYGNGHRRCLSRWMMKHAKKIAQDKEWEKGGKKNYLSKFFFSSFFGRRCMYSKHMYNTVESRSPLSKPFQNFTQPSSVLFLLHFPPSRTFHFKCLVHGNAFKHVWVLVILFENHQKCLIWTLAFSINFRPIDFSAVNKLL